ncbi:unnamed protein product [Vitrella brassicaformis CCMP3155]|uniref:ACT domain-containing protein n=1 Tax=Vitrella brassicaformis (strain CCMP3155) TaxID=1169540 RepID=A0A0G4EEX7_VITBC|nr:unnamed protein product [Vitrella brassicaformis CCMP3155]|mmetsp:Transcript_1223/g.2712  ORF Transcript_1223/g.2712 Transcript_1223/m.2712 type:complete len:961 (-) Transcript_1223:1845-4727(-)|eukprot:CEL94064.1 unnamed protein product [Vitrella brassicaformis CCMP3155]
MAGGGFQAILKTTGFLALIWMGSKLSKMMGVSTILAEIAVGMVAGPSVANGWVLPNEYGNCVAHYEYFCTEIKSDSAILKILEGTEEATKYEDQWMAKFAKDHCSLTGAAGEKEREKCYDKCKEEEHHHCGSEPSIFELLGTIGVSLVIFESGMHFDFERVRKVGVGAFIVAVIGTCLPLAMGAIFVGYILPHKESVSIEEDGVSAGIALAPTSVGISIKLLTETKQLGTDYGQAIVTAAFVDDVFSLIAFIILQQLGQEGGNIGQIVGLTFLYAVLMLVGGAAIAMFVFPPVMTWLLAKIPIDQKASFQPRDQVQFFIMFVTLCLYGYLADLIGSHLLGCFVAGMSFTMVPRSHTIWKRQTKRGVNWLLRLFFAATVGFAIPVDSLFTVDAFWKGLVIGLLPCIGGKILAGLHMGQPRWIIGWAMVGRAEFAFLVAQSAHQLGLMSKEVFAYVIWGLLWATIITPFAFKYVLTQQQKKKKIDPSKKIVAPSGKSSPNVLSEYFATCFRIQFAGRHKPGVVHEITGLLHEVGLDIVSVKMATDGRVDVSTYVVRPRVKGQMVDDEKLDEIHHSILEAIESRDARVVFHPAEQRPFMFPFIKINIICGHHVDLINQFALALIEQNIVVRQANIEQIDKTLVSILMAQELGESRVGVFPQRMSTLEEAASVSQISNVKIGEIKKALYNCLGHYDKHGSVFIEGLDPAHLGPTGEVEHDPMVLTDVPASMVKVSVKLKTNVTNSAIIPRLVECAKTKGYNLLAARIDKHILVLYVDSLSNYQQHKGPSKRRRFAFRKTAEMKKDIDEIMETEEMVMAVQCADPHDLKRAIDEMLPSLDVLAHVSVTGCAEEKKIQRYLSFDITASIAGSSANLIPSGAPMQPGTAASAEANSASTIAQQKQGVVGQPSGAARGPMQLGGQRPASMEQEGEELIDVRIEDVKTIHHQPVVTAMKPDSNGAAGSV